MMEVIFIQLELKWDYKYLRRKAEKLGQHCTSAVILNMSKRLLMLNFFLVSIDRFMKQKFGLRKREFFISMPKYDFLQFFDCNSF